MQFVLKTLKNEYMAPNVWVIYLFNDTLNTFLLIVILALEILLTRNDLRPMTSQQG